VNAEQLANLPAASLKALADVLTPAQIQRLRGIYLQQKGNAALLEADVKKELKIAPEQVKTIQAALEAQTKAQTEMMETGGFDPEKMQELQKATTAKIQGALTQEQKTALTSLLGQPFQLAGGGFGGGKGGGGFGQFGKGDAPKAKDPGTITEASLVQSFEKLFPAMNGREAQQDWQEICFRVGAPGNEELRLSACKLMAAKLVPATPKETRLWLLRQLQYIGRDECIQPLAAYLGDQDPLVRDAAVRALAANLAPEASQPLITKLSTAKGDPKIALINALGRRGGKLTVPELIPTLAKELKSDAASAIAAARALGKIASPEAAKAVAAVRSSTDGPVRLALNDAYILCADQLLKEDNYDEALAIYKTLHAPNEPRVTQMAALRGVLESSGNDAGPLVVAAIGGKDADAREIAVVHLGRMRPAALKAVAPAVGQKLLDLARDPATPGHRLMAFSALVRLAAAADDRSPQDKLNLLKEGLKRTLSDDERKILVEGLGEVPSVETLRYAETYLDNKALAQPAARAILQLARSKELRGANQAEFANTLGRIAPIVANTKLQSDLAKYYQQAK
jgi:HEAT repeat protein